LMSKVWGGVKLVESNAGKVHVCIVQYRQDSSLS